MTMHFPGESDHLYQSHSNDPRSCSLREKRISRWRRGRISASTRSLPRFYNSPADNCNEVVPKSTTIPDAAPISLASNTDYDELGDKILTIIDIHEHIAEDENNKRVNEPIDSDDDVIEDIDSLCFSSRLRKLLLTCIPQSNEGCDSDSSSEEQRDNYCYDDHMMTQIECILGQSMDNGPSEDLPTSSSLKVDTQHPLRINKMIPPSEWNQNPLLLVATPGCSGMRIRRVRRISETSYFETPESFHSDAYDDTNIIQLPINNGKEHPSYTRVIDFETELFAGTALFRIRGCNGWRSAEESESESTTHDYFAKQNRKFQMVIRGKFKKKVIMADCMSGLLLDHQLITSSSIDCGDALSCADEPQPCDKRNEVQKSRRDKSSRKDGLPSKLALRTAVKVAGVFSPRMDADLECASPRILSPLCSTAQTITVSRNSNEGCISPRLEASHAEPFSHSNASLINDLRQSTSKHTHYTASSNSVQYRKIAFDAVYDAHASSTADASPCFDQDAEYTFEFLQHLIDYNDLSLDCGKVIGKIKLGGALRGQPVRFVSVVKRGKKNLSPGGSLTMDKFGCLWSFDLWHSSLHPCRR